MNKMFITLFSGACTILCLFATQAGATTITFDANDSPHYWEVEESISDVTGWVAVAAENGALDFEERVVGQKITYDIFNNTNYTITGFAVGVNYSAGQSARDEESHEGWGAYVTNRWEDSKITNYWDSYLQNYDYAYYAYTYQQIFEPGNPDYSPAGEPLAAFTGITNEFSFTFDVGDMASPLVLFATDGNGQEIILTGESSHFSGENRQYTSPDAAPVPEPATCFLLATGLAGLGVFKRKKRN